MKKDTQTDGMVTCGRCGKRGPKDGRHTCRKSDGTEQVCNDDGHYYLPGEDGLWHGCVCGGTRFD